MPGSAALSTGCYVNGRDTVRRRWGSPDLVSLDGVSGSPAATIAAQNSRPPRNARRSVPTCLIRTKLLVTGLSDGDKINIDRGDGPAHSAIVECDVAVTP